MRKVNEIFSLSFAIAKAEFKLKNEGTWLGIFWYLLSPLLTFALLYLIFNDRLGQGIDQYPLYLFLGIIIFNYFQKICDESLTIVWCLRGLVKSLAFPREALIWAVVIKMFLSHLFELAALIIFLLVVGIPVGGIGYYFIVLFFLSIFSAGISLILSALFVSFFDLNHIWGFFSKLVWFGTPIFYAIEGQTRLGLLNLFNPLYYFITVARSLVIYQEMPQWWMLAGMVGYSLLAFVAGSIVFRRFYRWFAEII